jgi:RNA polymerase sigma factor (sigma-70 family)
VDLSDGDLVALARAGDGGAFRLLVERYRPSARARALRLCGDPDDADDIVQESLLQAFVALERLRDPGRFAGWLAGIVLNVHRAQQRRARVLLLADWPEWLQPAALHGLQSADDIDRADVVRQAVAGLPAGQRRAVQLFYYADRPAREIGESAAAAKTSLHKARRKLREHIATHRPDLIPSRSRRNIVIPVRIAYAEPRPGDLGDGRFGLEQVLVVLADDHGGRALPLWLPASEGYSLWQLAGHLDGTAALPEDVTGRLLHAVGATVAGVEIDEIGPDVTAAQVNLSGPAGTYAIPARIGHGLAIAAVTGAPVGVADTLMDRLGQPAAGSVSLTQFLNAEPAEASLRSRPPRSPGQLASEPRNLKFGHGLDGWLFGGSFRDDPTGSHWQDYTASTQDQRAILASAVERPRGSAFLGQAVQAGQYRHTTVRLRADISAEKAASRAKLHLQIVPGHGAGAGDDGPDDHVVPIAANRNWASYELTAAVPGNALALRFGITLTGTGRITLRNVQLDRSTPRETP